MKTRLARDLGKDCAVDVYRAMLEILFKTLSAFPKNQVVLSLAGGDLDLVLPLPWEEQPDGNLGEKMEAFFKAKLKVHSKVILIGSDSPYSTPLDLKKALEVLERDSVVIQPAADGGYTLIGMREFHPQLFSSMPWSTSLLMNSTLKVLNSSQISFSLLAQRFDIDTLEDLKIWFHKDGLELIEGVLPGLKPGVEFQRLIAQYQLRRES
ncbi:glycosyltransferase [bacterium]|nr:glycosyltransferase [bacterium]